MTVESGEDGHAGDDDADELLGGAFFDISVFGRELLRCVWSGDYLLHQDHDDDDDGLVRFVGLWDLIAESRDTGKYTTE